METGERIAGYSRLVSWIPSEDNDDEAFTLDIWSQILGLALRPKFTCRRKLLDLMGELGVFFGDASWLGKYYLPLQLQVSAVARAQALQRPTAPDEPKTPPTHYRVLCLPLDVEVPWTGFRIRQARSQLCDLPMIGWFDLSAASTALLLRFRSGRSLHNQDPRRYPSFAGSQLDFESCREVLVKEIRANKGGTLTESQQLYMSECVEKHFIDYWFIKDAQRGNADTRYMTDLEGAPLAAMKLTRNCAIGHIRDS
jgi:hypothetical protein